MQILIVGPNSYIARNFKALAAETAPGWTLDTLSVRDERWRTYDYSPYDSVLYCAAVVHQKESPQLVQLSRRLNCDIPVEMAKMLWAQSPDAQFIFLSTMAVFGLEGRVGETVTVNASTTLSPRTTYAKTKLAAEEGLCAAADGRFALAVFRPPMVYGPDCPGNYRRLMKFVLTFHVFPTLRNQRSMIHVHTLSERLLDCAAHRRTGFFHPQEPDYLCTADLAREIAEKAHSRLYFCPLLNPLVRLGARFHPAFHKIWGGLVYDKEIDA